MSRGAIRQILSPIRQLTEVELHGTPRAEIILHDLCVVIMISVFPRSKTAYFGISKNRPISRLKKKYVIKGDKNIKFTELELQGTSGAEILYFA